MSDDIIDRLRARVTHPVFNRAFVPVQADDDTLHVRAGPFSGPVYTITDTDGDGDLTKLPSLLDGHNDIDEIVREFSPDQRTDVIETLFQFVEHGIVYDASRDESDRSWPYLSLTDSFGTQNRQLLESTELLVISVGSIGSYIAQDVLDMGVGSIRFATPLGDTPVPTGVDDRFRLTDRTIEAEIRDADILVYATDDSYPRLTRKVNELTNDESTPWMLAQVLGFDGLVGPTIFPGESACYECLVKRMAPNVQRWSAYQEFRRTVEEDNSLSTITLSPLSRLVAGFAALDLVHLLAYGQAFTVEKAISVSALDISVEVNNVLKYPRCDVCGKKTGDDVARFIDQTDLSAIRSRQDGGKR